MKKIIITWIVCIITVTGSNITSHAALQSPVLNLSTFETTINLSWSKAADAKGYTLSYAPYPLAETISHIDMGERLSFSAKLWDGAAYYVAVRSRAGSALSEYSNVDFFQITSSEYNSLASSNDFDLTKILQENYQSATVPGACLHVSFTDGSVWEKAIGNGSIESGNNLAMDLNMRFRIGSITKTMVATCVLLLVEEGKLNLDDTVDKFLPGLITYGGITIEELLSHSSRLVNYTNMDIFEDIYLVQPEFPWTKIKIVDLFKNEPLMESNKADQSFYSNANYYLLGMIIEKISEMDLDNFMKTRIFSPLAMTDTYLPVENMIKGYHANGYVDLNLNSKFEADEKNINQNPLAIWSAGSVISTVKDLSIWLKELMAGSLISNDLQKKRMAFNWQVHGVPLDENGNPLDVKYGLGIMNQFGQKGHTGAVAGYTTVMFRYLGNDIIAYTNGFYLKEEDPDIPDQLLQAVVNLLKQGCENLDPEN